MPSWWTNDWQSAQSFEFLTLSALVCEFFWLDLTSVMLQDLVDDKEKAEGGLFQVTNLNLLAISSCPQFTSGYFKKLNLPQTTKHEIPAFHHKTYSSNPTAHAKFSTTKQLRTARRLCTRAGATAPWQPSACVSSRKNMQWHAGSPQR